MIYFDAAYVAKCYLDEPGAVRVRAFAHETSGLTSCELARLEFSCILLRQRRERHLTQRHVTAILRDFARDEDAGVWHWLPMTATVIAAAQERIRGLPGDVFVRAGDALHLTCAHESGFHEVYTNDRHMLAAARHFGVKGIDLLAGSDDD